MNSNNRGGGLDHLEITGPSEGYKVILRQEALEFLALLFGNFAERIETLLAARSKRQSEFDEGKLPDFLMETAEVRNNDWKVGPIPTALLDRRVEITGPVDRKMIINALNSDAKVYMADFEDSSSPTWNVMMDGQVNLRDAVNGTIEFVNEAGKKYELTEDPTTLLVRPRGLHLKEKNIRFGDKPVPAALVDFGLFFFHNAYKMCQEDRGPFFYLPKLESYLEARLWNEVFIFSQERLEIPIGTVRATVLIETIPAVFQMDEILWELKEHASGLNCGRWDYIFSFIKCFRKHPAYVLPDRKDIGMDVHFLDSYSKLLIETCHRRGAHAMGGMAAQIPIKDDQRANEMALEKVRQDKEREAKNGHDGTWVAHPGLISVAQEIFDRYMPEANQIGKRLNDLRITQKDLLSVPTGTKTMEGFKINISAALRYIEEWLCGVGCVPLNNLMEDAATAEISRAQIWQWVHHVGCATEDGSEINLDVFRSELNNQLKSLEVEVGSIVFSDRKFKEAAQLLLELVENESLAPFLTLEAYHLI